jgi:sulfur-carrier protein
MPKVMLPTPLRPYADKQAQVTAAGETVGDVLKSMVKTYPALAKHMFDDSGALRSFVNVYVNDEDIRYMSKLGTPVKESDVLSIIPSIAGGAAR